MLVHLADERPNLAVGELVDAVAEQRFVLAELRAEVANCRVFCMAGKLSVCCMRRKIVEEVNLRDLQR